MNRGRSRRGSGPGLDDMGGTSPAVSQWPAVFPSPARRLWLSESPSIYFDFLFVWSIVLTGDGYCFMH